jgi:hypothetical protein
MPALLDLIASVDFTDVPATAAPDKKLRGFKMVAYTGGPMRVAGFFRPVVIDLAGVRVPSKSTPVFRDHDPGKIVGHGEVEVGDKSIKVEGLVSAENEHTREVVTSSLNGFPWQASVGASVDQFEVLDDGQKAAVNGQTVLGPLLIARKSTLGEVSFVPLGADRRTSARIMASAKHAKGQDMDFDTWLETKGLLAADLNEQQKTSLQALFEKDVGAPAEPEAERTGTDAAATATKDAEAADAGRDAVAALRAKLAAETSRIHAVRNMFAGKHAEIEAKAIAEGWDLTRCELEKLRADRPPAPAITVHGVERGVTAELLEAACALTAKLDEPEKHYSAEVLEQAHKRYRGSFGLQELLLEAAWANGYTGRTFRQAREVLQYAFGHQIQAAFSDVDIGGILSNIANKFLIEGFYSVERTWRNIAAMRNVNDFKTVTSYRLIGKDQYEQVPPGGEIKHGTLGNETFTNKADTYALMLSIDRRDIINDDLGAITLVPRKLGRGSGLKINDVFWKVFLNNAAFYTAANRNFLSGAGSVLSIDGLTQAETMFMEQVDADGKPIGIMPSFILVPPSLSAIGAQLFRSLELRDTTAGVKYPISNPHQGKYQVEVSRYLSNTQYSGNSRTAWYLLANPDDLPVIEVAFLNGQEVPIIENAMAEFNVLGVEMRGYHDFGVALQDPKGGLKSAGA